MQWIGNGTVIVHDDLEWIGVVVVVLVVAVVVVVLAVVVVVVAVVFLDRRLHRH